MFRFCEFRVRKAKARWRSMPMTHHRDAHRGADVCPDMERPAELRPVRRSLSKAATLGGEQRVPPDAERDS